MTLKEAMNKAAKHNGYKNFDTFYRPSDRQDIYGLMKEAAELYAKSAREQAIDEIEKIILNRIYQLEDQCESPEILNQQHIDIKMEECRQILLNLKEKK